MKAGAFAATFIAIGLIAYQHQPSFFGVQDRIVAPSLPSTSDLQTELLKYSQFATTTQVSVSANSLEFQIPAESLFIENSTAMKPESDRQFLQLVSYLDSLEKSSHFEVSLLGYPDPGFNAKFRSTRARRVADSIKKAGVSEDRIKKVWQVLLDPPTTRDLASQAGPNAGSASLKSQYFVVRILTAN